MKKTDPTTRILKKVRAELDRCEWRLIAIHAEALEAHRCYLISDAVLEEVEHALIYLHNAKGDIQ